MASVDSDVPLVSESDTKKKKPKKRPSDFEIVRTILQRTHERKLPFLLKNMGEHSDILFFCSQEEDGFTYGSPDLAIAIFEFTDPELSDIVKACLGKLYGLQTDHNHQCVINVRDQISELAKTKGVSIDTAVESNIHGSHWCMKNNVKGEMKPFYYVKAIDSLFHMQLVGTWCNKYRPLLTTDNPDYLYYPYRHLNTDTGSILTLPPVPQSNNHMATMYPDGFRAMVTKGLDVITDKFLEEFPYPIVSEDMIVFQDQSASCQMAHRIIAEGWRMILLRPNAVFFPKEDIPLEFTGHHTL